MEKIYKFRVHYCCLFLLVLVVAGKATVDAQTVTVRAIQQANGWFEPVARNIAPGSDNNIMAAFSAVPMDGASATVASVKVTLGGTYTPADIKENGFKLWFLSDGSITFPLSLGNAVQLSSSAVVASGNDIVFSDLNRSLHPYVSGYFFITADIAADATMEKTIRVEEMPPGNVVLETGISRGLTLPAFAVQTIGLPLPQIMVYGYGSMGGKLSPGSTKNHIYEFHVTIAEANDVLKSLRVPVGGTVAASDIAPNGFRLWYKNHYSNYEEMLAGSASLGGDGTIVFSNLDVPVALGPEGNGSYNFYITVDLAAQAVPGRTIWVGEFFLRNFTFEYAPYVTGSDPMSRGGSYLIAVPAIAINSIGPPDGVVSPGSYNNNLYKLKVGATNANAAIASIRFTTGGTYQASDISGFRLFAGDELYQEEIIATAGTVSTGDQILFTLSDVNVREEEHVVFYLMADIAPEAVPGRTIHIQPVVPVDVTAASGVVSGTTSAGGIHIITLPSIEFTPAGPPAGIASPGSIVVLHTAKVDVSGAPATFESVNFQLSGTYQPSDIGIPYDEDGDGIDEGVDAFYLVYHTTADLLEELEGDGGERISLLSREMTVPPAGANLRMSIVEDEGYFDPTIPLGVGYITLVAFIRQTAEMGHTIQVASVGTTAFTLRSGTIVGATGTGGVQTIGAGTVAISAPAVPAGNIGIGGRGGVVYKIKLDITDAAVSLEGLSLTTGGNYQVGD